MGVERSVIRWYIQRQLILNEIDALEDQLQSSDFSPSNEGKEREQTVTGVTDKSELQHRRIEAQRKLQALGECPRPMMG